MNASDAFKAGQLGPAIDAQLAEVKSHPADPNRRLFLFELLLFSGDLDRAHRQGELITYSEVAMDASVAAYLTMLRAERQRRQVLRENLMPPTIGDMPESLLSRVAALRLISDGRGDQAAALLDDHPAPAVRGTINGQAFASLVDGDDVLAPVLEVITAQGYFWVPMTRVRKLTTQPPKFPRDMFWLPATLDMDTTQGPVFLPALYAFSHESGDDAVKLGHTTEWAGTPTRGLGQKTLLAGNDAVGLLEVRELIVTPGP